MKNNVNLGDCMEFMKEIPDGYFQLAIDNPKYLCNNISR